VGEWTEEIGEAEGLKLDIKRRDRVATTKATVCIVESLKMLEESSHREGEIIFRTLRLSEKPADYIYIRSLVELRRAAAEFGASEHRYLHISCHGSRRVLATTLDKIEARDFAKVLIPYVDRRRVFLSACFAGSTEFAKELLEQSECWSVVCPVENINFDDAAIFWTNFYHLMFKKNPNLMKNADIKNCVETCANLVEQRFALFYRNDRGKVNKVELG
jgi:hypothetical protein